MLFVRPFYKGMLAIAIVRRHVLTKEKLFQFCRALSTSRTHGFETTQVLHADPILPFRPADYGKYHEPSTWESLYLSFADSTVVKGMETYLTTIHDFCGLPWWATIILSTIVLRSAITAPLFVYQTKKVVKHRMLMPALQKIAEELKKEGDLMKVQKNWDDKTRDMHVFNSYRKHQKRLFKEHKVPGTFQRYLLPWVQLPLWISMSTALRRLTLSLPYMAAAFTPSQIHRFNELSSEGFMWTPNLCAADPTMILPVLTCLFNLAIIEVHRGDGKTPLTGSSKVLVYFVRFLSVSMIPIGYYMPSGVVLYWVTSSTFGLVQALIMQSIRFKKLLRLPIPPNHSKTPYRDILERFKFKRKPGS